MKTIYSRALSSMLAALLVFAPAVYAKKDKHAQQPTVNLQGKVVRYLVNPFGEIDGLFLDNGTLVKTSPYLSGDLAALIKPGDTVALQGTPEAGSSFKAYAITNTASSQTILRREPERNGSLLPKHLRAVGLKELSADGKIKQVITGKRGEPKIVMLENGTNIRLPKNTTYGAYSLVTIGAPFAASGYGTENQYGRSLEATTIGTSPAALKPLFGTSGKPRQL